MARIEWKIHNIELFPQPERNENSIDEHRLHPELVNRYVQAGYPYVPTTPEKAAEHGQKHFNGLASSFYNIQALHTEQGVDLKMDHAPVRYLFAEAMRRIVENNELLVDEQKARSPHLANVASLAPIRFKDRFYLISQIRGKATHSGFLHGALSGGGITGAMVGEKDVLENTLRKEFGEELGSQTATYLASLCSFTPKLFFGEYEMGLVNLTGILPQVDLETVLHHFETFTRDQDPETLETSGLGLIPLDNGARQLIETGRLSSVATYRPGKNGLEPHEEELPVIPYGHALIDWIQDEENKQYLIEQAGH